MARKNTRMGAIIKKEVGDGQGQTGVEIDTTTEMRCLMQDTCLDRQVWKLGTQKRHTLLFQSSFIIFHNEYQFCHISVLTLLLYAHNQSKLFSFFIVAFASRSLIPLTILDIIFLHCIKKAKPLQLIFSTIDLLFEIVLFFILFQLIQKPF